MKVKEIGLRGHTSLALLGFANENYYTKEILTFEITSDRLLEIKLELEKWLHKMCFAKGIDT